MHRIALIACAGILAVASTAQAKSVKWMDATGAGLPVGGQMAVISGDPSKATNFKVQLKMPANYTVPPHHHPTDEVVRVRSGTLSYGMGDKVDPSNAGTLSDPKTHVTMQAGMNHWVMSSGPTVVEVTGMGPFQITYVNPKDDPRNK